ncbi:ComF family protein [Paenimyroides tangerinum]|uniref:ComF family protein n=1 Tax=Paenimyroides tangerinum TaxID=2488728 RepID=A0A3P3WB55_9FLAO|nr:double zinc ribbon domain-containing protein [Paenimyroides tangerinum]RRJ92415.1 ComF family protein [Paenimyroides tangerinum]
MFQHLFNLVFPKKCLGCNETIINTKHYICPECLHSLDFVTVGNHSNPTLLTRFFGKLPLVCANGLIYYDKKEVSHNLIHELKYKDQQNIGILFAELTFEKYKNHIAFKEVDELVAVPLHKKKEKERGYNQLDSFGKRLSELTGIPYNKERLTRNFYTTPQAMKKNLFLRSSLKSDLFTVNYNESDYGKHFMILDDVVTTGSTLEILGKELLKIPNSKISTFFMAVTK